MRRAFRDLHQTRILALWSLAVLGRLALSITSFTVLLVGVHSFGGFLAAGVLSAAFGVTLVVTTPVRCAMVDRYGWRALVAMSLLFAATIGLCALMAATQAPFASALLFAALAGGSTPPWGPAIKAQLSRALEDPARKRAVFALDSASEDVVYSSGPAIGALLSSAGDAPAALCVVSTLSVAIGLLVCVLPKGAAPELRAVGERTAKPSRKAGRMMAVLAPAFAVGVILGSVEILAPSRTDTVSAGVALSALAACSAIASLVYGALRIQRLRLSHRAVALVLAALLSLSSVTLVVSVTPWTNIVAYSALGILVGPTITTLYLAIDSDAESSALSAGWVNAMLNGGTAAATTLVGVAIGASRDFSSIITGIVVTCLIMVLLGACSARPKGTPDPLA